MSVEFKNVNFNIALHGDSGEDTIQFQLDGGNDAGPFHNGLPYGGVFATFSQIIWNSHQFGEQLLTAESGGTFEDVNGVWQGPIEDPERKLCITFEADGDGKTIYFPLPN